MSVIFKFFQLFLNQHLPLRREKAMSKLGQAKVLGGIGALLSLLVFVPTIGFIIGLVGLVFVFVAVKYIAEETKHHAIFHNYLMNFIFDIIAIGAVIGIMIMTFGVVGGMSWVNTIQQQNITDFHSFWANLWSLLHRMCSSSRRRMDNASHRSALSEKKLQQHR